VDIHAEKILILDFGSQTTQLIARRVREAQVYCEIHPFNIGMAKIREFGAKGIILSGGPACVLDKGAPVCDLEVLHLGVPVLGICYGMQLMTHLLGGEVERAAKREYGKAQLLIDSSEDLFHGLDGASGGQGEQVWMSHGDKIKIPPPGFTPCDMAKPSSTGFSSTLRLSIPPVGPKCCKTSSSVLAVASPSGP
jgi:GMP synthase (glutamine-hydrolysing)